VIPPDWLWIPITIGAALAQTARNAAQKNLTASLGALGATLVRFLYGLPFALLWLAIVKTAGGYAWPEPRATGSRGYGVTRGYGVRLSCPGYFGHI